MSRSDSFFVTFDDAVARMINFDYIPQGFSLLDMTAAFKEEAEVDLENAQIDQASPEEIDKLREHFEACDARHRLAEALLERLALESNDPDSDLEFDQDSDAQPRISIQSLAPWAGGAFGIGIQHSEENGRLQAKWEDATIKIYADFRLAWRVSESQFMRSSYLAIGLLDKRTHGPNLQGGILIGLASGKKFPAGSIQNKDKAAISRLRDALQRLTNISADPFQPYNSADGWRPRFKLINDRRNADERAEARAQHVPFDDSKGYDIVDDDGGRYLQEHDN